MDAVDNLGDAIDVTRDLLLPIRPWFWLKLAIVVFFVAGLGFGGGMPTDPTFVSEFEDPAVEEPTPEEPFPADPAVEDPAEPELAEEDVLLILLVVVGFFLLFIALWFLYALLGGIAEFVFIESLRTQEVSIRQYTRRHFWRGVRLFGFRLGVGIIAAILVGVPTILLFFLVGATDGGLIALIGVAFLLSIAVTFVQAIVNRFTSEFVAPIMLLESRGVLSGWRRFWPTFRTNWKEYVVYLLLVWVLQLVINIAAVFVIGFGLVLLAIPVFVLVLLLTLLGGIGLILAIPIVLLAALLALLIVAVVQMPIRTYFQYYALLLLGDTNADLDLIPEQRAAVRSGDGRGPGPAGGAGGPGGPGGAGGAGRTGDTTDTDPDVDTENGWDSQRDERADDRESRGAEDGDSFWDDRTDSLADSDADTADRDVWEREETDDEDDEDDERDEDDGRGW
ncbi:DUF7544 domain-containing protein [Natrarchaeobaculum aegyptiacum]|uniref:Uncharacterized protein n=1 Tax=Natrarchaeobaculum aegyptiacum TaxID=745377 RepID=A0A2Z2I309_9EURY|nr:hypothetical protein [Natrarchaeobaculum aegyptiacum]ARS91518.1 hypothetical protein B1756_18515 [Natrarchaeobaculum aegyptiacum]